MAGEFVGAAVFQHAGQGSKAQGHAVGAHIGVLRVDGVKRGGLVQIILAAAL